MYFLFKHYQENPQAWLTSRIFEKLQAKYLTGTADVRGGKKTIRKVKCVSFGSEDSRAGLLENLFDLLYYFPKRVLTVGIRKSFPYHFGEDVWTIDGPCKMFFMGWTMWFFPNGNF